MSIVLITGDHPRHKFFVNEMLETGLISGWIAESREEFIPETPVNLNKKTKELFKYHFDQRAKWENEFFSSTDISSVSSLEVNKDSLNSNETIQFINSKAPKLVISYGCHKLESNLIENIPAKFWNSHGGLSPDYRGVTTHFWPSYFLEPQMTGMTLHETTDKIDGGALIFQSCAPLTSGDTLHMLACRTVQNYSYELRVKLTTLDLDNIPQGEIQKTSGRIFKGSDWRPEHLSLIYDLYEDKIVDLAISGEILGRIPNLISVI